jgi:hypothetical protein
MLSPALESLCLVEREGHFLRGQVLAYRTAKDNGKECYIHYLEFDRRNDEWVHHDRLDLASVEEPKTKQPEDGAVNVASPKAKAPGKRKHDASPRDASDGGDNSFRHQHHRGGGKMDATLWHILEEEREEITKIKNIPRIQLGRWQIDTWYYSPYPERVSGRSLFMCEYTLKYMTSVQRWAKHRREYKGPRHPPGQQIYSGVDSGVQLALWEVDGASEQVLICFDHY